MKAKHGCSHQMQKRGLDGCSLTASAEARPAGTLILDFQPLEHEGKCCLSHNPTGADAGWETQLGFTQDMLSPEPRRHPVRIHKIQQLMPEAHEQHSLLMDETFKGASQSQETLIGRDMQRTHRNNVLTKTQVRTGRLNTSAKPALMATWYEYHLQWRHRPAVKAAPAAGL